jgi:predicted HNH restriction endonuclease
MDNVHNKTILTSDLKDSLVSIFRPTGEDAEISPSRGTDTLFTQIVRNLKSHDTLENLGYATYIEREAGARSGSFTITSDGKAHLDENINVVNYLLNNNFSSEDLKDAFNIVYANRTRANDIETFDENTTINEGTQNIVKTKVYKRSSKLREKAIQFYTMDNRIKCKACCFDFEDFYGEYGKGFIEIHHQKPVFQFDGDDIEQTITQALENVVPVCPNCHRMIHRSRVEPLSLEAIKEYVVDDLDFCED